MLKAFLFTAGFFVFSYALSFLLCDDHNSYARVMMKELYNQENIDILFCGASHVSHGILCDSADKIFTGGVYQKERSAQALPIRR